MAVNFGGFVPVSTVDWPGRAVCTVFLRGCPARCPYCHNAALLGGRDLKEVDEVVGMIAGSALVVSAVVFTGGEPTMQGEALVCMAREGRRLGLEVGVHTNGAYPDVLASLIDAGLRWTMWPSTSRRAGSAIPISWGSTSWTGCGRRSRSAAPRTATAAFPGSRWS